LAAKVDHSTLGLVSLRGLESSRSPRHARKVDTTYAKYIGRIGALAVSLGVGVAVATTPGVAWAAPDPDSDPPSSTSPDPESDAPKPSTPGSETPAQTAPVDTPTDGSASKSDTSPVNDRVPTMKVDSSGGALTSTHHTTGGTGSAPVETTPGTGAAQHAAEEQSTLHASDPVTVEGVVEETAPPVEVAPVEPVVPVVPVEPVVGPPVDPTDPQNDSPLLPDVQTTGSDGQPDAIVDQLQSEPTDTGGSDTESPASDGAALRMSTLAFDGQPADPSNDAQLTKFSALQAPAPIPFDPVAAVLAIPGTVVNLASQFVAFVLTPFLVPAPSAPAQMPVLWAVLAWVRREITHTFFNRSPISNPVQISQSLTGEVTGDLNASDPNCDAPLTYTVTQQPAHGTVVVRPDGTYTYTPTAGTPTTTLTDSFTVVIDDSVGTQLPGIFGVIQGCFTGSPN
jgi:VCBS repeat-containing protein